MKNVLFFSGLICMLVNNSGYAMNPNYDLCFPETNPRYCPGYSSFTNSLSESPQKTKSESKGSDQSISEFLSNPKFKVSVPLSVLLKLIDYKYTVEQLPNIAVERRCCTDVFKKGEGCCVVDDMLNAAKFIKENERYLRVENDTLRFRRGVLYSKIENACNILNIKWQYEDEEELWVP